MDRYVSLLNDVHGRVADYKGGAEVVEDFGAVCVQDLEDLTGWLDRWIDGSVVGDREAHLPVGTGHTK